MRVLVDRRVHRAIRDFYTKALMLHVALGEEVVIKKKARLYAALAMLGQFPTIYPKARLKQSWMDADYREMICEDFHFAFKVEELEDGEQVAVVYDAVHSLLYTE